jgi:site-specific recombinase XerD
MMLETYFGSPKMVAHLRAGPSGQYMDGFAASLKRSGYDPSVAVRYLRAAAHIGHFTLDQGGTLANVDLSAFSLHLRTCRCPRPKGGRRNHHTIYGARRYYEYLVAIGVSQCSTSPGGQDADPAIIIEYRQWLRKHRGSADSTVRLYSRDAVDLLTALGNDPRRWNARGVRDYFLDRTSKCGAGTAEKLTTGLRAFLRYLSARGLCQADLDQAVPTFASWRLARLPRFLTTEQVDSLVAACDGSSPARRRDRAIVLLLARLGLRAGDVASLRIADIEWEAGTLRVSGKGRYQVRLPLPQDVGDAILDYLACRPPTRDCDHIFVRNIAPYRPFKGGDGVSSAVRWAMKRAGVVSPAKGAHVLRHTAATQMLRHGVPLDRIGLVLRHRGIDTTAYYAKADVNSLKEIAQPWPEVLP